MKKAIQKLKASDLITKSERQDIIDNALFLGSLRMSNTATALVITGNLEKAENKAKSRAWFSEYGVIVGFIFVVLVILGLRCGMKDEWHGGWGFLLRFFLPSLVLGLFLFLSSWCSSTAEAQDIPLCNRASFGQWLDADNDCQNMRAEILIELSSAPATFATAKRCHVVSGRWQGSWSYRIFTNAAAVHIDHALPLAYAWQAGAYQWGKEKRQTFYNDRRNLVIAGVPLSIGQRAQRLQHNGNHHAKQRGHFS